MSLISRFALSTVFAVLVVFGFSVAADGGRLAPAAEARAINLSASLSCLQNGTVRLDLHWISQNEGQQWVDLTLFNNGFLPGTFLNQGPLGPTTSQAIWDGLIGGAVHYLRVNTFTAVGWQPSDTISFQTPICPVSGPLAATNLAASHVCLADGTVLTTFAWNPSGAGIQWLDLSLSNNGFAPGTFLGNGPFAAVVSQVTWAGLLPGLVHYARVNTLTAGGWFPSATLSFITPVCSVSYGLGDVALSGNAQPTDPALLTDTRIAAHPAEGYDRIVFEFSNALPNIQVGYRASAASCGSGMPINPAGTAILAVRFEPSIAHTGSGITVALDIPGTGGRILEAIRSCDFENVVSWAVGISAPAPFHAFTQSNPPRLVIDVLR